jgi:hypothetical protein
MGVALSGVWGLRESWHVAYSIAKTAKRIGLSPKKAPSFSGQSIPINASKDFLKRGLLNLPHRAAVEVANVHVVRTILVRRANRILEEPAIGLYNTLLDRRGGLADRA